MDVAVAAFGCLIGATGAAEAAVRVESAGSDGPSLAFMNHEANTLLRYGELLGLSRDEAWATYLGGERE